MNKSYIKPFKKRKAIEIVLAFVAALILGVVTVIAWWAVGSGVHDVITVIMASAFTLGFGCTLMALITGHLEWILLGYWLPY